MKTFRYAKNKSAICLLFCLIAILGTKLPALSAEKEEKKNSKNLSDYWQETGKDFNLARESDSVMQKISENELELMHGTFLIESQGDLTLKLPMAQVQMPGQAMLLLRVNPGNERFYCLLENANVISEKSNLPLRCGEEFVLLDRYPRPNDLTGEFNVGIRQLKPHDLGENRKGASMEFSIVQAMDREPLLHHVAHSKHSHDKFLRSKLLKAAAVLNIVTSKHGPYSGGY
ncbi:MAG: hypothetical protein K2X27_12160 [Candidatus Obscuribacterales bacterium]|nr:hypothetical protein [Candidatus Obscuribacterales bacterium]